MSTITSHDAPAHSGSRVRLPAADRLRIVAAAMRDHAKAATPGRWSNVTGLKSYPTRIVSDHGFSWGVTPSYEVLRIHELAAAEGAGLSDDDAEYIAAWDPTVALTVADLLDVAADGYPFDHNGPLVRAALDVAETYLRSTKVTEQRGAN